MARTRSLPPTATAPHDRPSRRPARPARASLLFVRACCGGHGVWPPRAALRRAGTGRRPHAPCGALGCQGHRASGAAGAALNKYGKSNHEARRAATLAVGR